ncbi:hypothetical protein BKA56DRAFT_569584 [Ilyonectria sp. MPI-CAGE-AT-0026]|nr:hypothetical protein BKA56DRAFT_569584 [Ilyonectria sp. MPI-CAGE-AT-0026]
MTDNLASKHQHLLDTLLRFFEQRLCLVGRPKGGIPKTHTLLLQGQTSLWRPCSSG